MMALPLLLLLAVPTLALHRGLQDLAAFPKYAVEFLNHLPIPESDAAAVRAEGLAHEDDFLDLHPKRQRRIDGDESSRASSRDAISFVPLRYTPPGSEYSHQYLCALPSANSTAAQTAQAEEIHDEPEPDPEASWRALSHLDGRCLYLRHTWFTYSYCHNKHIKQFRELPQPHPHPEGFEPKEDPNEDSYTLGVAHPTRKSLPARDRKEVAPEQTASFGVSPQSRYLVQRWTDGTLCDKTRRPREVEVQVYCSMTSSDVIHLIKEVAICQYIVEIHSPHLCSLPGFRPATAEDVVAAPIRCREVVSDEAFRNWQSKTEGDEAGFAEFLQLPDRPRSEEKKATVEEPETKLEGLVEGLDPVAMKRLEEIVRAAFGRGAGVRVEDVVEGTKGTEGDAPVYVVEWEEADGELRPADVQSVPPSAGEERREFLQRLQDIIQKELAAKDEDETSKSHDEL